MSSAQAGRMSRRVSLPLLVLVAGLPVLAAAWAVLSPSRMNSSEMTWDLLFNLSGAWHLWFGHVPHADFHEPRRSCWSRLSLLALLLFEPPARRSLADIVEMICAALILAAMFYLKITYFAAGVAMVIVAFLASTHVRARWPGWGHRRTGVGRARPAAVRLALSRRP